MSAPAVMAAKHVGVALAVRLRCPSCELPLVDRDLLGDEEVHCSCGFSLGRRDGIWRALPENRAEHFRRFIAEYGEIRAREGRGAEDDDYYLALPFIDLTGRNSWQWSIRGATFRYFESRILPRLERHAGRALSVLDIGAGNGWLSYRLALRGHCCVAMDLLDNAWDGLGATSHYLAHLADPFAVVQAEMDRLPFDDRQFDLVIFNASFHYSTEYARTLRETLRCLRPGGSVVILDTAFYRHDASGRAMVREREAEFERKFGFKSNSIAAGEYLTHEILRQLHRGLGVRWRIFRPWYGWQWALRPWKARLHGRREPSKFYICWGRPQS